MRAHHQRRILWILDVVLLLALLGLGAWYALDVRKAVADPSYLNPAYAEKAIRAYEKQPLATQKRLRGPVSEEDKAEIDPPKYMKSGRRFHWPYSGPLPPPPPEEMKIEKVKGPVTSELEKLGSVLMLLYSPPDEGEEVAAETVVGWKFKSGKVDQFKPGEFFEEGGKKTNIRLVNVTRQAEGRDCFDLHYEVWADPDAYPEGEPASKGTFYYNGCPPLPANVRDKVRVTGPGSAAANGIGQAGPGKVGVVETAAGSPGDPAVVPGLEQPKVEDVKPKIEWESYNKARIEFNQDTFDYFRSRDPDTVAKSVKTQVAKDKKTGKTLGLKITSMGADSPAEKFDVRPGDILVSIDGKPVQSRSDAVNIVTGMNKDISRVTVVIDRNGRKITYVIDPRDPKTRRAARYLEER